MPPKHVIEQSPDSSRRQPSLRLDIPDEDLPDAPAIDDQSDLDIWIARLIEHEFRESLDDPDHFVASYALLERMKLALQSCPASFSQSRMATALTFVTGDNMAANADRLLPLLKKNEYFGAVTFFVHKYGEGLGDDHVTDDSDIQKLRIHARKLYDHWNNAYCSCSLAALKEVLRRHERSAPDPFGTDMYSKTLSIIQSSGTGKSRLADEMGKECFSFPFVFRMEGQTGYPPGDAEVTSYFCGASSQLSGLSTPIRVACFLAAVGVTGE